MPLANKISAYSRLMRLHQPVGIWLLLWPCWWGLAMAGTPSLPHLILFLAGAVLMRSAGCIMNDLADRKFDREVTRTKTRPLASGEVSAREALILLAILLSFAALVAILLGPLVFLLSIASLLLVATYPFMKRITWWPQLFLGFTFNWVALLGYAATAGELGLPALLLYVGGIFWTLGYDTIYAHQDKEDDARIGVKSTALLLKEHTKPALIVFYTLASTLWLAAGIIQKLEFGFFIGLTVATLHLFWQIRRVDIDAPANCLMIFRSNRYLGLVMLIAIILG